jgi:hypothetical protein
MDSTMIEAMAVSPSPSQSKAPQLPKLTASSAELSMPWSLRARMRRQITATSAIGKTTGMKKRDRKNPMALSLRLSRIARASAKAVCTGTTPTAKVRLFRSARRNGPDRSGSVNSRRYCSIPNQVGSSGEPRRTL